MQIAARGWSPGTVLAGTLIVSAFPLVAVEVFPVLKFVIAPASYLLFHNIAEFFSVMVSLSMFGIGWFTYDQSKNRHALFLSTAFLGIGLMDFMHTLANVAMPPFITPNSSNKSTQFWIFVRLFQAVAFLASAYVYPERPSRWLSKKVLMTSALLIPFLVFAGITFFPAYVPATFVPGAGLTPFKRISEYLIIGMLCAAAAAYWWRMTRTGDRLLIYYTAAFVICLFSELPFAVYTKVFDTYNVLGHIYKVAAFYLIYYGIYRASVKAPYVRLMEVGEKLRGEIVERRRTEEELREAHNNLELRVQERTSELAQSNTRLRTEVDDRRKAEQALREAHDRALWLARFPDENPSPVVRVSADGTVLYCNSSAVELHGWTCAVGRPLDYRLLPLVSRSMAEGEESRDIEIGGRSYSVWVAPFPKEGYANVYGRDITDRKRAEQELRLAYGRLQTFFDQRIGGIGIVIANAKGDIIQANDYYLSILGCTREELMSGQVDWRRMTPPEWLPSDERALAQLGERGVCDTYEKEYVRRDGSRVPVLITDAMMPGGSGEILAFVLDITERKRAEEALQKAHAQLQGHARKLQETNRELEGFAYTISHDLRAPLRAINGFARMLTDDYGPSFDEEGKRRLAVIETSAIKMGLLIDDLLALSRAGRTEMNVSRIDMNSLVSEIVEMLKTSYPGAKADVLVAALPPARGDNTLIRQVLSNLLENAVKFSRNSPEPRVEVGSLKQDDEQVYFVKDNGVGFDMKYYGKLFGVFERLVTEKEFEGTGVGLAIVKRLIARHGGRVWAEAKPGEGATFFFTLNRKDPSMCEEAAHVS